jgi:hypothetical protein
MGKLPFLMLAKNAGAQGLGSAKYMDVQMIHLLPAHSAIVDDDPEAIGATLLAGQLPRHCEHFAQNLLMAHIRIVEIFDMYFRDDQKMHWRRRVDVVKGENLVVFVNFAAGDRALHDLAKNAVGFVIHLE